jgi:DNA polymerase delta subunit 3
VAATKKEEVIAPGRKGSASEDNASGRSTPQPAPAATKSILKRTDSKPNVKKDKTVGDIFKSFAKAKPKAKEPEKPKEVEDEPMQGMSEDEGEGDDDTPEVKVDNAKMEAARKAREDVEEGLRKMMEADVEMQDATPQPEKESQDSVDAPSDTTAGPTESEPTSQVQAGRRRGRRRVTKKKKVKDADGYLGMLYPLLSQSMSLITYSHQRRNSLGIVL